MTAQGLGCKVFSATMAKDREALGDKVTTWLAAHPTVEILDRVVKQSSDNEFHCVTVVLWYRAPQPEQPYVKPPPTSMPKG